jgi:hypothetical protein
MRLGLTAVLVSAVGLSYMRGSKPEPTAVLIRSRTLPSTAQISEYLPNQYLLFLSGVFQIPPSWGSDPAVFSPS